MNKTTGGRGFRSILFIDSDVCFNAPVVDGQFLEMQHVNQMIGCLEGCHFYGETIDDLTMLCLRVG